MIIMAISSSENYSKIEKIAEYTRESKAMGKVPVGLFSNTVIFQEQSFINTQTILFRTVIGH